MGRQFSFYACPEDLAEIEAKIFRTLGGTLIATEKRDGTDVICSVHSFPLERDRMGMETLFLYLEPPAQLQNLVYDGPWLDSARSNLIEVGRSFIRDGRIGLGRFWFEPNPGGNEATTKLSEFNNWAARVFRQTKTLLERHPVHIGAKTYREWFGKVAWQEIRLGNLRPATSAA